MVRGSSLPAPEITRRMLGPALREGYVYVLVVFSSLV